MNAGKIITDLVRRYAHGTRRQPRRRPNPGIQKTLNALENDPENDVDSMENFDVEDAEADFGHAHESYSSYKRELSRSKDTLKQRIVARKYFKELEPSLLTYVEKEQIRNLHDRDPVEYTPEKLSESFPSLPHTIRKVLKARWTPRSADKVLKHDENVIENWKKFKRGELPLEPRLREHLQKFKGRIIKLPDRDEVEKSLIPPPINFPKPKSQLYSSLVKTYLDQNKDIEANNEETRLSLPDKEQLDPGDLMERFNETEKEEPAQLYGYENRVALRREMEVEEKAENTRRLKSENHLVTLEKFFENTVKNISETPSLEDRVLVDTYKRNKESESMRGKNSGFDDRLNPLNFDKDSKSGTVTVQEGTRPESIKVVNASKEMGLETYVKVWVNKDTQEDDIYPEFINIPRDKYNKNKIYQLRDCYYDNDGEFLYRVPGLKD